MSALDVLRDPQASPTALWRALEALLGPGARVWEPETLRVELERLGAPWEGSLEARVLGGQTILTTHAWTHDHDVLFAFALACDGHPAGGVAHPTAVQLAWAVSEIEELTGEKIDHDAGFDPDGIDPAIAVVLHDDGWVIAPEQLAFCQEALTDMDREVAGLRKRVRVVWDKVSGLPDDELSKLVREADENDLGVQITHLADCAIELRARARLRAKHLGEL